MRDYIWTRILSFHVGFRLRLRKLKGLLAPIRLILCLRRTGFLFLCFGFHSTSSSHFGGTHWPGTKSSTSFLYIWWGCRKCECVANHSVSLSIMSSNINCKVIWSVILKLINAVYKSIKKEVKYWNNLNMVVDLT